MSGENEVGGLGVSQESFKFLAIVSDTATMPHLLVPFNMPDSYS